MSIESRVQDIVSDVLKVSKGRVTGNASIADLGGDSLDAVEIVLGTEEEFDIDISDEEADRLTTVGELITLVETLTRKTPVGAA